MHIETSHSLAGPALVDYLTDPHIHPFSFLIVINKPPQRHLPFILRKFLCQVHLSTFLSLPGQIVFFMAEYKTYFFLLGRRRMIHRLRRKWRLSKYGEVTKPVFLFLSHTTSALPCSPFYVHGQAWHTSGIFLLSHMHVISIMVESASMHIMLILVVNANVHMSVCLS